MAAADPLAEPAAPAQTDVAALEPAPTAPALLAEPAPAAEAVPVQESPQASPDAKPAPVTVTVQPGFTLWGIARENFGDGVLYVQVFAVSYTHLCV